MVRNVAPPSVATALASMVLPVPGGPKSRTPLTASEATPSWYSLGYLRGYVMHCRSISFTSSNPPIISYVTPISCGEITFPTKLFSCLSVTMDRISSILRTAGRPIRGVGTFKMVLKAVSRAQRERTICALFVVVAGVVVVVVKEVLERGLEEIELVSVLVPILVNRSVDVSLDLPSLSPAPVLLSPPVVLSEVLDILVFSVTPVEVEYLPA
mmetsp:Transcript_44052/g.76791  ORF Transcript_44052/g.76791 Transcript_44052/m.76791 type:complete len:212 (+) Transcript_44052:804-1439(+)